MDASVVTAWKYPKEMERRFSHIGAMVRGLGYPPSKAILIFTVLTVKMQILFCSDNYLGGVKMSAGIMRCDLCLGVMAFSWTLRMQGVCGLVYKQG